MADNNRDSALRYAFQQNLNPYFQNQHMAIGASPAESPLNGPASFLGRTLSPRSSVTPIAGSSAPAPMTGNFSPLAGMSSNFAADTPAFRVQDRFPFSAEAHKSPAIRG